MGLCHYVIVRRDLPVGVAAAMLVHAAGESGAVYDDPLEGRFRGSTAVVLGVDNELELFRLAQKLRYQRIQHVEIVESDPPYKGQLMAIGVVPCERDIVSGILREYPLFFKPLDNPMQN